MKLKNKLLHMLITGSLLLLGCGDGITNKTVQTTKPITSIDTVKSTSLVVLGTLQDAGSPQIACKKKCCKGLLENPDLTKKVVSLGLIDAVQNKTYLFEATPDIGSQIKLLTQLEPNNENEMVDGIFLTHAHIGHYTGLMYLGKEAMDAKQTPVYVLPKMHDFLSNNGPWSQLVLRENIKLKPLTKDSSVQLSDQIKVTHYLVPHRDEFSETACYKIQGPTRSALFIPDIDKWDKWERDIVEEIKLVDYAFLDATFFDGEELNNRDISEIPHPFVIESLKRFENLTLEEKQKVIFIHFNHTNPIVDSTSSAYKTVLKKGFRVARFKQHFEL